MSWEKYKLKDLVDNFSIRARDYGGSEGLQFLGVSNDDGIVKSKSAAEHKGEEYKIIEKCCFAYNPYRVNIGSIAYHNEDVRGLISPAYVIFKTKPNSIKDNLLLKFLKSAEGLRQIRFHGRGTVRQALRFEDLCKIEISLPSYEEQENLLLNIENIEKENNQIQNELKNQLSLIKQLRQAFLREAMQGRFEFKQQPLEDGELETGAQLLEKIKAEKAQLIKEGKLKKEKLLPPITTDEIPFEIPENWVWCRLGEVVIEILGGYAFDSTKYSKIETNNQVIRLGNVKPDQLVLDTTPVFIDEKYANEVEKALIKKGDILITMTGTRAKRDYLFSLCLTEENLNSKKLYLNQRVGCLRFNELISIDFINKTLKDIKLIEPIFESSTGAANQANIGITALREMLIPLPPLREQNQIVSKLDELMAFCDGLEESIKESQGLNEKLLQEVLREALQGEKV
jgi:type I restriction enzyme S subunit